MLHVKQLKIKNYDNRGRPSQYRRILVPSQYLNTTILMSLSSMVLRADPMISFGPLSFWFALFSISIPVGWVADSV